MRTPKKIGPYSYYDYCRFCLSTAVIPVVNLGNVPLAGGFIKKERDLPNEKLYPLELIFCKHCFLLQTSVAVSPDTLFKNYFYYTSAIKTLVDHFVSFADQLSKRYKTPKDKFIVEIGCNDGVFLLAAKKKGFSVLGIDPATNIVSGLIKKGYPIIDDYFTYSLSKKIVKQHGQADIIISSNTMAHIEDMHTVINGVKNLLKKDGIFVFEVHYLGNLIEKMQFDMIYHEHHYYYSLRTLQRFFKNFDLEIFDITQIPIHGGSIRYYVQHKKTGKNKITKAVKELVTWEKQKKLHLAKTFIQFNTEIKKAKKGLVRLISRIKKQKKTVFGYGASGRGTILFNYSRLTKDIMPFIIDDAKAKQHAYMPGTHQKISSSEILYTKKPNYVILSAWSFIEEIKNKHSQYLKNGGKFIIPLPKLKILSNEKAT